MKFLRWKSEQFPAYFSSQDMDIIQNNHYTHYTDLTQHACYYSKRIMKAYTKKVWQESLNNRLSNEGWVDIPIVSLDPLVFPLGTARDDEVRVMSMFYKNNLLNAFLFKTESTQCPSPMCACLEEEQTPFHLLTSCGLVDNEVKDEAVNKMLRWNDVDNEELLHADCTTILNCSRDSDFIKLGVEVVRNKKLDLRKKIKLGKTV